MKVFVNYPVMVTPGVYRHESMELDMTVEQVPYAVDDLEHRIVINNEGCFICVDTPEAVEKLTMMKKDYLELMVEIDREHKQALIETWCLAHGIDPRCVTYENGKICIPISF